MLIASSQIMQQRITQLMCRLYKPDIMVGLPADSYGMFEFYRSEEILEAGRAATRAVLERLETDGEKRYGFLLKAKKRLRRPVFEEFKSSDATSQILGPSQCIRG